MPGHSTFWRWTERIGAIGSIVGLIVLLASEGVREAVADAACWLYPGWLIGSLGLAVVGLVAVLVVRQRPGPPVVTGTEPAPTPAPEPPPDPVQRERDRRLVRDLTEVVPRPMITFLREHDFGNSWREDRFAPLDRFMHERVDVEWHFGDPEMEALRSELMGAVKHFLWEAAVRAGLNARGHYTLKAWEDTPRHGNREDYERRYQESREMLNDGADAIVKEYDALLVKAREKGLLD